MTAAPAHPPGSIRCPKCTQPVIGEWTPGTENDLRCPRCASALRVWTFPALAERPPAVANAGQRAEEGEATCYFHPQKRAELACDGCGRFLCALCHLPLGQRNLCPACLAGGEPSQLVPELISRRIVWGRISLILGVLPLIPVFWAFWPVFFVAGPGAIFAGLYGWGKPGSLVHGRRRLNAVFGITLGFLQIGAVVAMIYFIWRSKSRA